MGAQGQAELTRLASACPTQAKSNGLTPLLQWQYGETIARSSALERGMHSVGTRAMGAKGQAELTISGSAGPTQAKANG
jgi:hypothetical protein